MDTVRARARHLLSKVEGIGHTSKLLHNLDIGIFNYAVSYCQERVSDAELMEDALPLVRAYTRRCRMVYQLLTNPYQDRGQKLLQGLLSGEISVQAFCETWTAKDFFPELCHEYEQEKADRLKQATAPSAPVADGHSLLKCFSCIRNGLDGARVGYVEAQTRRADEGATIFATCTVCNKRWRFS